MAEQFAPPVILLAGFLCGIRLMQSPRTALWGNRLGALCMALAVAFTFWSSGLFGNPAAWACLAVGGAIGLVRAQWARTIEMPQLVALLNGLGGGASALVICAGMSVLESGSGWLVWFVSPLALGIGALTFSGSMVAVVKLQGWRSPQPASITMLKAFSIVLLAIGVLLIPGSVAVRHTALLYAVAASFFLYGLLMAARVGGADMPVLISLLNAFSGVAASVSGIAMENALVAGTGALVGVTGMLLTLLMCRAMNRNLMAVLSGFTVTGPAPGHGAVAERAPEHERLSEADIPGILHAASNVLVVPGYGMALAQAQQAVKDLMDALESAGKEVKAAIHPVAGRMPGHMHVLLAEVGIDYDKLHDMAAINEAFAGTDVVIAVGACDVINPAAATAEGTPIYGMPILRAFEARHVIIFNLDERPGYSGVDNSLYNEPHVITVWGNAAESIPAVTEKFRHARA